MVLTFRFPVQVVFGEGSLPEIRHFVKSFGKHALLVSGGGPTSQLPAVQTLQDMLGAEGVAVTFFPEVESDPGVETVERGVAVARENGCDFVIGLGGGSPMDAAKVIAARLNNEGDVSSWEGTVTSRK
jgi:alcohol dehydrogenase class IV